MSQQVVRLDADYVGRHRLPDEPAPQSYDELQVAINGLLADAARWLDENGPAEYLHLCTVAIRARETCCVGKVFMTDIRRLDLDPDPGVEKGHHIPCLASVPLEPGGLTGDYVRAHALPEVPEPDSYGQLRDAINDLIRDAANWLGVNGPTEYLHLGSMALKAYGECCVWVPFIPEIRPLPIFSAREVHVPC